MALFGASLVFSVDVNEPTTAIVIDAGHWRRVRQIEPTQLAFLVHHNVVILTYLLVVRVLLHS